MSIPIKDFLEIENDNNIYPIKKLKKWRDEHHEYFDNLHEYFDKNDLWKIDIGLDKYNQPLSIPVFCDLSEEETSLWLFNQINRVVNFFEVDIDECKKKMDEFYRINLSKKEIEKWFSKNTDFEKYIQSDYINVYLNYSNSYHFRLFILNPNNDRIFVDRNCFEDIIDFYEIMSNYDL